MGSRELMKEIIATYERHGWKLRRLLARPETVLPASEAGDLLGDAELRESDFDALWFARPSHGGSEAWELRLGAEQRYALFEVFEADESEEDREEARREMENRLRDYVKPAKA